MKVTISKNNIAIEFENSEIEKTISKYEYYITEWFEKLSKTNKKMNNKTYNLKWEAIDNNYKTNLRIGNKNHILQIQK